MPENPLIRQLPRPLIEQIFKDPGFVQVFLDLMYGVGDTLPANIVIAQETADTALVEARSPFQPEQPQQIHMPATQPASVSSELPVGSVYMNLTDNRNPTLILGYGVWTQIQGQFIAAYQAGDPDFGTLGGTGGSKTTAVTPTTSASTAKAANTTLDIDVLVPPISNPTVTVPILPPYIVAMVWYRTA